MAGIRDITGGLALISVIVLLASAAVADDPPPQTEPSPEESPIGRFLGRLFGGVKEQPAAAPAQQSRAQPRQPAIDEAKRIVPDAIDARASVAREQQRDLLLAQRLLAEGQRSASLTVLQQLLDAPEDTLILTNDGRWESLQQTTEQVLAGGGPDLRAAYLERFGGMAADHLREAKLSGDPRQLARVTRRFLHTPAGREAALSLAERFRDIGEPVEAQWWRRRAAGKEPGTEHEESAPAGATVPRSAEWAQPFGGPRHQGRAAAADPVLIERWSQPIAARPAVAEQVERLTQDLVDSGRACVPAAMPLAVDGKLITRTLRGVSVFDADSGRRLWESAEGASVERLLSGAEAPRPGGAPSGRTRRMVPAYRGTNPDAHPLTGLLFRDGVYGLLSSDGEQVFVLEEHATLSYRQPGYFWGQRAEDDPFDRDWATNELTAYDLDSGAVRWRIGGERLDEPFDSPLAGTLFLGPPVVDRDELFLIGERGGTVSLFCLDRQTGHPLWSHAVSETGVEIGQDLVRRWWPAQPAVGAGVIVCPTTEGWLVAVDRLEQRIRWAYRYIEARQKKVSSNRSRVATAGTLNSRWSPAAPVLTDRYVLFTPPELPDPLYREESSLVCVDVLTGDRVWRERKGSRLYLGGVAEGRVLLVGKESLEARDVATGKRLWETTFNLRTAGVDDDVIARSMTLFGDAGQPSGRGLIAGDEYLMPLQSGQLWVIGLAEGDVRRTMTLRDAEEPLANLLVYQGRLYSAGPLSVRSFERRSAITSAPADADPPATATTQLRAAELQSIEGDLAAARRTLQALSAADLTEAEQSQRTGLLWDTLIRLVRGRLEGSDTEFAELDALVTTDAQRRTVERVRADRLLARGEPAAAFDVYWRHARTPRQVMVEEDKTSLRIDRWLAGRLKTLREAASPEDRAMFDERIADTVDTVLGAEGESLSWWADVLRFHADGARLRRVLAERALAEQRWAAGEIQLLQIIEEQADADVRAWAIERLVQLLLEQQRSHDAAAYLARLSAEGAQTLEKRLAEQLPTESLAPLTTWSDGTWTLRRSPASYNRSMFEPVLTIQPGLPSVRQMKLRVEPNLHRLSIETIPGEGAWETPLRWQSQSFYNQTTGVASVGQLLLVVHRGVLHAVSVADRAQLWRQPFDLQSASAGFVRGPSLIRRQELRTASSFLWSDGLRQTRTPAGMLAVWRPGYVAYFGRHTITVADPLTGETLWSRRGIRPRTMVYGTSLLLYIVPPSPEKPYVLRALDGGAVPRPRLGPLVPSAVGVTEQGLVVLRENHPLKWLGWGKESTTLMLVDPENGDQHWTRNFPGQTRFARLDHAEILAVATDGEVNLVNCTHGTLRSLGRVGEEAVQGSQRLFAIPDGDRVYLALNRAPKPGSYSRSYQSAPVNGTLAAFDRQRGLLWSEPVEDQNLVLDQLAHLPVLVFTAQRPERNGDVTSQQVFVELREQETGRLLLQDARFITGGNLREMAVDHAQQLIDLKTYKDRLRLSIADE